MWQSTVRIFYSLCSQISNIYRRKIIHFFFLTNTLVPCHTKTFMFVQISVDNISNQGCVNVQFIRYVSQTHRSIEHSNNQSGLPCGVYQCMTITD